LVVNAADLFANPGLAQMKDNVVVAGGVVLQGVTGGLQRGREIAYQLIATGGIRASIVQVMKFALHLLNRFARPHRQRDDAVRTVVATAKCTPRIACDQRRVLALLGHAAGDQNGGDYQGDKKAKVCFHLSLGYHTRVSSKALCPGRSPYRGIRGTGVRVESRGVGAQWKLPGARDA